MQSSSFIMEEDQKTKTSCGIKKIKEAFSVSFFGNGDNLRVQTMLCLSVYNIYLSLFTDGGKCPVFHQFLSGQTWTALAK